MDGLGVMVRRTGWTGHLLQDESRELSRGLATRLGARRIGMDALKDIIEAAERKEFEQWYANNAFNYERDPVG